jgi:hypothetical protein
VFEVRDDIVLGNNPLFCFMQANMRIKIFGVIILFVAASPSIIGIYM